MTTAELKAELRYRRDERLAIMGFYSKDETPSWALTLANNMASSWATAHHPEAMRALREEVKGLNHGKA